MKIDTAMNLIYVKGTVPGPKESLVRIRDAVGQDRIQFDPYTRPPPFPTCTAEQLEQMPSEVVWTAPEGAADPVAEMYKLGTKDA
jgi:large subunit ribosomal protein L3